MRSVPTKSRIRFLPGRVLSFAWLALLLFFPTHASAEQACTVKKFDIEIVIGEEAAADIEARVGIENPSSAPPLVLVPFEMILPGLSPDTDRISSDWKLRRSRERKDYFEATIEPPLAAGERKDFVLKIHAGDAVLQDPDNRSYVRFNYSVPRFLNAPVEDQEVAIRLPKGITANEIRWYGRRPDEIKTQGESLSLVFKGSSRERNFLSVAFPGKYLTRMPKPASRGGVTIGTMLIVLFGVLAGYAIYFLRKREG